MKIISNSNGAWNVWATWYGQERIVHTGDLFDCIAYVRNNENGD